MSKDPVIREMISEDQLIDERETVFEDLFGREPVGRIEATVKLRADRQIFLEVSDDTAFRAVDIDFSGDSIETMTQAGDVFKACRQVENSISRECRYRSSPSVQRQGVIENIEGEKSFVTVN
jgi:hypothetical protein